MFRDIEAEVRELFAETAPALLGRKYDNRDNMRFFRRPDYGPGLCLCGASFELARLGRPGIYCSPACRSRFRGARREGAVRNAVPRVRTCPTCLDTFPIEARAHGMAARRIYCSKVCSSNAYFARKEGQ